VIGIENTNKRIATELIDSLIKKYGEPKRQAEQPKEDVPTVEIDENETYGNVQAL
jgi:hypothetical protein